MNVVGRVGSLITQGVYSVATPFHPFGGAVDIIVVKQQDGTFRSTPWYVRFGKFQGVLKGAEKIVRISVNGVEANFHMYLDNSGEAYFLREVVPCSEDIEPNDQDSKDFSSFRTSEGNNLDNIEEEDQNLCDVGKVEVDDSRTLHGSQDEQSPLNSPGSPGYSSYQYERVYEVKNLVRSAEDSNSEVVLMSIDGHVITAPISMEEKNTENLHSNIPQFHLGPAEASDEDLDGTDDVWTAGLFSDLDSSAEKDAGSSERQHNDIADAKGIPVSESETNNIEYVDTERSSEGRAAGTSKDQDLFKSCLDLTSHIEGDDSQDALALELDTKEDSKDTFPSIDITLEKAAVNGGQNLRHRATMPRPSSDVPCSADLQSVDIEIRDFGSNINDTSEQKDVQPIDHACLSKSDLHYADSSVVVNISNNSEMKSLDIGNMVNEDSRVISAPSLSNLTEQKDALVGSSLGQDMSATEEECNKPDSSGSQRISGYGFEISLCGNLLQPGMGRVTAKEVFEAHQVSEDAFKVSGPEIIKNENLIVRYEEGYYPWDKVAHVIVGITLFGSEYSVDPTDAIPVEHVEVAEDSEESHGAPLSTPSRRWRLWPIPFRRVKSHQRSTSDCSDDEVFLDSQSTFEEQSQSSSSNSSPRKKLLRTNIPTSEQIASLNLKDGQNTIAFSFSTRVLGKQQVDAHIYLWKWNTRIVISDVDGTITRSDVLGQVMPLVGRDWTQSGVASLFSAIEENGYQLLFLSARAIVQAYLTKSFLSNLKQDGKALPSGPVVISPDGLFPSLYREVIRRAPHEFKIACLEDIRALFPSDYNPFYAGFGNRDTDELTYRKIGIPKGKIFIINPKGEVALYNRTDVKSYTSLHTMVHDMFPPTSLAEQEEYNSWNYWKVPLQCID